MNKPSSHDETRDFATPSEGVQQPPPQPKKVDSPASDSEAGQASELDQGIAAGFGLSEPTEQHPQAETAAEVGMLIGGKYKLIQAIGEGGMGSVWLAEQKEPVRRKVAVKLVKAGMDSRQVLARFEAERQALAMMDHPNIAKVLDGGVTDRGRPYFVMELVKGIPLTEYCDQVQYSIRERLELFGQVCAAVQHAHQKGIIHRDLKPSNVLVTEVDAHPNVKVIDFGLAKALHGSQVLTDLSMHTAFGAVLGTPLYMAPEQLGTSALDVDTRADLYSLGVILYELLTGTTPIERQQLKQAAFEEMCRMIREEEPQRPSTRLSSSDTLTSVAARRHVEPAKLTRLMRGELDWIIMKALEKDRNRRYETANGFAMDIHRYLNNEPVLASPPSRIYRWRKFVARNKWQTLAGVMVLLALFTLVGFAVSLSYTGRLAVAFAQEADARELAEEEGERAERQRQQAELAREAEAKSRIIADQQRAAAEVARGETAQALQLAERYAYFHKIALADSAFQSGDVQRADQLLEECPVLDRGFEWNLLKRRNHAEISSLTGHKGAVHRVRYSPDGSFVASAGDDGSIRMWDPLDGRELACLDDLIAGFTDVAMHPSGRFVAGTGENGTLMVWDVTTQRVLHKVDLSFKDAGFLAYESRGVCLIIVNGGRIEIRDASDYRLLNLIADAHSGDIRALVVSPDGKQLATASWDQTIKIWDIDTAKPVRTIQAMSGSLMAVSWSPDGLHLASSGMDFSIAIWDAATGKLLKRFKGHEFTTRDLSFSPDGQHLASAGADGSVKIWDWKNTKLVQTFWGHYGHVTSVDWDAEGRYLISGGFDGTVKRWSISGDSDGLAVHTLRTSIKANRIAFGPDGTWLVKSDSEDRLEIVDTKTGAVRRRSDTAFPGQLAPAPGLDVHPDGHHIATGDQWGRIHLVDMESCEVVWSATNSPAPNTTLKFSPDGRWLVSGNLAGELAVWDVQRGRYIRPIADAPVPHQPSPEDPGSDAAVVAVLFHPNQQHCIVLRSNRLQICDFDTGRVPMSYYFESQARFRAAAITGDGTLVALSDNNGGISIWDFEAADVRMRIQGHSGPVNDVCFSPDGKHLVSTGADRRTKIWDVELGYELITLRGLDNQGSSIAIHPQGEFLAVSDHSKLVRIWSTSTLSPTDDRAAEVDSKHRVWLCTQIEEAVQDRDWTYADRLLDQVLATPAVDTPTIRVGRPAREWALSFLERKDVSAALEVVQRCFAMQERLAKAFPQDPEYPYESATTALLLAAINNAQSSDPTPSLEWFQRSIQALEAAMGKQPQRAAIKDSLAEVLKDRALALDLLGQVDKAELDWARALELASEQGRPYLLAERAFGRLVNGQIEKAVADAEKLISLDVWNASALYNFACIFARGSAEIEASAESYAEIAMKLLWRAHGRGWREADHSKQDSDLNSLRDREDFKKWLLALEKIQ